MTVISVPELSGTSALNRIPEKFSGSHVSNSGNGERQVTRVVECTYTSTSGGYSVKATFEVSSSAYDSDLDGQLDFLLPQPGGDVQLEVTVKAITP